MAVCGVCGNDGPPGAGFCPTCGRQLGHPSAASRTRKTVTVLFADVAGSTELGERLETESLQRVMAEYFETARAVVERHGGTVEKFIGDAVMAAFGVPLLHEDDALRGVRAAFELRDAVDRLNGRIGERWGVGLRVRIGLNSGEVVAGDPAERHAFVAGDPVNVAARLQQAAAPGEIVLGDETYRHVRGAVRADRVGPLELKGKSRAITAWRLSAIVADEDARSREPRTAFVGRENELGRLEAAFGRVETAGSARLVAVLGEPGIGKSRLVGELLERLGDRARVLGGRCLSYGDGITYWPLREVVEQLVPRRRRDDFERLLDGDPHAGRVAERIEGAIGRGGAEASSEETHWAVRRLLEAVATERPLLVVFDDVQWAEPTFLDLIEHIASHARAAPVLLVCLARPELRDTRPSWFAEGGLAEAIVVEQLSGASAEAILAECRGARSLPPDARARVLEAAEGNPLFLEQMLAMYEEAPVGDDGEPPVPATIQMLLAARIDHLPTEERSLLQRAAVEGRTFHRDALLELVPRRERDSVDSVLGRLARRGLVRRDRFGVPEELAYRFSHILVREAAYAFLPKEDRAVLHERFAGWVDRLDAPGGAEYDEIVGYHLEQAYEYRVELGRIGESDRTLAARASGRLEASGRRAFGRGDLPAAINLFERAARLLAADDRGRRRLLPELGEVLAEAGRIQEAEAVLSEALAVAEAADDDAVAARALVESLILRLQVGTKEAIAAMRSAAGPLEDALERNADELGLARLRRLEGLVAWVAGRSSVADEAWRRAASHARRAGDRRELDDLLCWLAASAFSGAIPATQGIERCEGIRRQVRGDRRAEEQALDPLAGLYGMTGRFDLAGELLAESAAIRAELGLNLYSAVQPGGAFVALLAGDFAGAESSLRSGYTALEKMGERALLSTVAAMLAQVLYLQGWLADARRFAAVSKEVGADEDISTQMAWRRVQGKLEAREGRQAEGERILRRAIALGTRTDWLNDRAEAAADLAEVLELGGRRAEARTWLEESLRLYELKENIVGADVIRVRLEDVARDGGRTRIGGRR